MTLADVISDTINLCIAGLAVVALCCVLAGCRTPRVENRNSGAGGYGLVLPTGSMEPKFTAFDLMRIIPFAERPFESVVEGDVVLVREGAELGVMHRAVFKGKALDGSVFWVTKGDANPARDHRMLTVDNFGGVVVLAKKAEKRI